MSIHESIEGKFVAAVVCQRAGNLRDAISIYREILSAEPNHEGSIGNLAIVAKEQGNYDQAAKLLQKLIQLNPKDSNAHNTLGNVYHEQGNMKNAIRCYKKAVELNCDFTSAYINLGVAYQNIGNTRQSIFHLQNGLKSNAESADINFCLANVYSQSADYESAISHYYKVLQIQPHNSKLHSNLALCLKALHKNDLALDHLKKAIDLDPYSANAHYNLGSLHQEVGYYRKAVEHYKSAIKIDPNFAQPHINLAKIFSDLGHEDEALTYLNRAVLLSPKDEDVYYNLGNLFAKRLDYKKSNNFYQISIQLGSKKAVSNYLLNLHYSEKIDRQFAFDEHKLQAKKIHADSSFEKSVLSNPLATLSNDNKIRVGYLSSDFREHSVSYFLEPVIEHHDYKSFDIFCFHNSDVEDGVTDRIKMRPTNFISIHGMSDSMAFDQIKRCNLHILIDLNGHTEGNRLEIVRSGLARKILSWIGYPNTTGLESFDYKITDSYCDPPIVSDQFYVESLLHLDGFFLVYRPPSHLPKIQVSPYLSNGYLTFGSFNNFKKINPSLVHTWSHVLKTFPKSNLILKNSGRPNSWQKKFLFRSFETADIDSSRVKIFERMEDSKQHLNLYNLIDMTLDTHPYSGTTTTFESLIMGVPVFTLTGQAHVSRVTGSILHSLGLNQFIADSKKDYIPKLESLTRDKQHFDKGYRKRLLESDLCDGLLFTKKLEAQLKSLIQEKP